MPLLPALASAPPASPRKRHAAACAAAVSLLVFAAAAVAQNAPVPQVSNIPSPGASALAPASLSAAPIALASDSAGAPTAPARVPARPTTIIPANTPIQLQLETHLSTRFSDYGDGFAARVTRPVYYQGQEVIPTGSIIEGHVILVRDERPVKGESKLLLKPDLLAMPGGRNFTISAHVIQGDPHNPAQVDQEGVMKAPRAPMSSDIHHAEIAGGAGLVSGALLAGAQGALIGTGVGAAAVAGFWLLRRRHLSLNPGSLLTVRLDRPLALVPKPAIP